VGRSVFSRIASEAVKRSGLFRSGRRWPVVRVGTGGTGLHASRPTRPCRAPPPSIRGLIGSCRRVLHARRCVTRTFRPSRPSRAGETGPSARFPSDGAHGVLPFADFIPRAGGRASRAKRLSSGISA
jgi:hypothetical protein